MPEEHYKLLGKDNPMRDNNIRVLYIMALLIIVTFIGGCNFGKPNDDDPENKTVEVKEQWVLIKSDTLQSRLHTMKELGLSAADMNARMRGSSSMAQSVISNYFTKNGRIKKIISYN